MRGGGGWLRVSKPEAEPLHLPGILYGNQLELAEGLDEDERKKKKTHKDKAHYLDSFLPMHLNGWKTETFIKIRQALGTAELGGKREAGVHGSALQG